jgi:hypothetical protein
MSASPSSYTGYDQGILVISSNTLNYGTYMLNYSVTISYNGGSLTQSATTYITIVPTGLNVFGLTSGILQQTYGTSQQIVIDPGSNTVDLDAFVNPATLNYTFYCQVVPNGQSGMLFFNNTYPVFNLTANVFQLNSTYGKCFTSNFQ